MANSYVEIPVTGVDSYAFPFPYLEQSHINVYAGGVLQTQGVHYTFTDSNTIEFSVGNVPTDTTTSILIQRVTDGTGRLVTYSNTGLDADDLNLGSNQNFYLAQEAVDAAALNITKGVNGVTSVDGRLTNVEDPIDAQDAATKAYVASQLAQSATGGVYIQTTEPTSASLGDLWVDPDNNIMSVYTSTGWANGGTVESTSYNFTGSDLIVFGSYYIIPNVEVGVANIDQVFINGVLLKETTVALDFTTGDWDRSSSFIAFENALASDDEITITTTARMSNLLADAVVNVNANLDTVLALASSGSVNGITLKEQFTATAGQQVFNLTNSYVQGQNNISVYVNGVLQTAYGETSTSSVTLTNPASLGDEVVFIINEHNVSTTVTESDNVTYTPAGTGAVATTVQEKLRETVSVKDFGAVGDGVTDDTAAIQSAATYGKSVYFPAGSYRVTDSVLFSINQLVYGEGNNSIIISVLADTKAAFTMNSGCKVSYLSFKPSGISPMCIDATSKTELSVSQCTFDLGNFTGVVGTTLVSNSSRCINLFYCSDVSIRYNSFNNGWNDQTYDASTAYAGNNVFRTINVENLGEFNVDISFNSFNMAWTPIYCSNTNAVNISNNHIDTTADTGIFERCTSGITSNKKINHNTLIDIGKAGIKILDSNNLTALGHSGEVIGNIIDGHGLKLSNSAILSANNFDFGVSNVYLRAGVADRAVGLIISGNVIKSDDASSTAFQVANIDKIVISDNIIYHPNLTVKSTYLQWCSSAIIANNTIDVGLDQLEFYSCEDITVDTNKVKCSAHVRFALAGLTDTMYTVTNNFIDNLDTLSTNSTYGLNVILNSGTVASMIITGNTIKTTIPFQDGNQTTSKNIVGLGTAATSDSTILDNNLVIFTDGAKKQKVMFGDILNPVYYLGSQGSSTYDPAALTLTIKPSSDRTDTDTILFTT